MASATLMTSQRLMSGFGACGCSVAGWGYPLGVHGGDRREGITAEEAWLEAAGRGDREALGCLYDRFSPGMLAVAQRVLGSPREAEDLVHDVFLEAWHRAQHYDRSRGTVQTWLMLRLRSRALDRLRAGQRRAHLAKASSADAPEPVPSSEAETDAAREANQLRGHLSELNADQRTVLELAYFEGVPLAEIAERLAVPIGTVKSRMSRAIAELRQRIQGQGGSHE
jgi:RNA polymerase sigma-70 factor (ECF subfamily)